MNIKFILFVIIGIILFFILNNIETLDKNWILIFDDEDNQISTNLLSGSSVSQSDLSFEHSDLINTGNYSELQEYIRYEEDYPGYKIFHLVEDSTTGGNYKLDMKKCNNPHSNRMGYNTFNTQFKMRNRTNNETEPLVPRDNLLFKKNTGTISEINENDISNPELYNYGDEIIYEIDTSKSKNETSHKLKCTQRRKIIIISHGSVHQSAIKTTIPSLMQYIFYRKATPYPDDNGCMISSDSIVYDENLYNSILYNSQSNEHIGLLENNFEDDEKPIQEIVYSEMTKFIGGILYHGSYHEIFNPIMQAKISNKNIRYYTDPDNPEIYHCFCDIETNKLEDPSVPSISFFVDDVGFIDKYSTYPNTHRINEYAKLLNPWLMKSFSIFDSIQNISDNYFPKQINFCSIANGFINNIIENNGAIPFEYVDKTTINGDILTTERNIDAYRANHPDGSEYTKIYIKYIVSFPQECINSLKKKIKQMLILSSISIEPNKLTSRFHWNDSVTNKVDTTRNDVSKRLFINYNTSTLLPLFNLDIYTRDGFIHPSEPSVSGDRDHRIDANSGNYTSSDLRAVVKDITLQIYLKEGGYYEDFKRKIKLEKKYNDTDLETEMNRLYSNSRTDGIYNYVTGSRIVFNQYDNKNEIIDTVDTVGND